MQTAGALFISASSPQSSLLSGCTLLYMLDTSMSEQGHPSQKKHVYYLFASVWSIACCSSFSLFVPRRGETEPRGDRLRYYHSELRAQQLLSINSGNGKAIYVELRGREKLHGSIESVNGWNEKHRTYNEWQM